MPLEGNAAGFYININLTNTAVSLLNVGASKAPPAIEEEGGAGGDMSASKSWLGQSRASKHAFSYELPRWQDPASMLASIIPRPILPSTSQARLPAPLPAPTPAPVLPPSSAFLDNPRQSPASAPSRQRDLEADLQFLLDAQAEGLLRGLNGEVVGDDQSSAGSRTPTARSYHGAAGAATKKPARKRVGLRRARKGIYGGITALSELKGEELEDLNQQIDQNAEVLQRIDEWDAKRKGLHEAQENVESDEETVRAQRLRREGDALQAEINQAEMQLADMKARHRRMADQLAAVENSVQAKLSSYTASLRLLEEDVQKFLSIDTPAEATASSVAVTTFRQTPVKRRTLDMARDYYHAQQEGLEQQHQTATHEKAALDQGANIWRAAGEELLDFERRMRAEMVLMSPGYATSAWEEPSSDSGTSRLRGLIEHMDALMTSLNTKLQHAEEKKWNLVIAALGAELAALRQGRKILGDLIGEEAPPPLPSLELVDASADETPRQEQSEPVVDPLHALDEQFRPPRAETPSDQISDEDPDPDLLFSKHEPESPENDRPGSDLFAQ